MHRFALRITTCYAIGSVSGTSVSVGGLVGWDYEGTIASCFWDTETSGLTNGVGDPTPDPSGVSGKTTSQMKTLSTFTDAGWDFVGETANGTEDIWWMPANDYPRLDWERFPSIPPDFNADMMTDILWRRSDDYCYVRLMDGVTQTTGFEYVGGDTTLFLKGLGDLNADGKTDTVWRRSDGYNYVRLMDGVTPTTGYKYVGNSDMEPVGVDMLGLLP